MTTRNGILRIRTADESLQTCFRKTNGKHSYEHGSRKTRFDIEGDGEIKVDADSTDEVSASKPSPQTRGASSSISRYIGPSPPSPPSMTLGVTFDKITIRNYNRTVADNPSCSSGVPVGLSWEYNPHHTEVSVDMFESGRSGYRRDKEQMRMPEEVRLHLLRDEFGVSMGEMLDMTCKVEMSKRKRKETLLQNHRRERVEKIVKSANRGFRKMLSMDSKENNYQMTSSRSSSSLSSLPTSSFQRMLSTSIESGSESRGSDQIQMANVSHPTSPTTITTTTTTTTFDMVDVPLSL